jgi:PKHD-type hydroxylase
MILRDVLSTEELGHLRALAETSAMKDGAASAHGAARAVKANQHANLTGNQTRALTQTLVSALERHPLFFRVALPRGISAPAINRYASGMSYGFHYDLPLQFSVDGPRVRADLSATLLLSAPDEYEGGLLQVTQDGATQSIQGNAGDLLLYPAGSLHQVSAVSKGERYAIIFWVQSMVREHQQRALIYACDQLVERISQKLPGSDEVRDLTGLFVNLGQMWMDP